MWVCKHCILYTDPYNICYQQFLGRYIWFHIQYSISVLFYTPFMSGILHHSDEHTVGHIIQSMAMVCFIQCKESCKISGNPGQCAACAESETSNVLDLGLTTELLEYKTEEGIQGWVALLIVRPEDTRDTGQLPTAILLHPTGFPTL